MNILITDYHCASNRGDAAILEGELVALREQFPDASITVATEYPHAARTINGVDAVKQRTTPFSRTAYKKNAAGAYLLATAPLRRVGLKPPKAEAIDDWLELQPYHDADLVISTGGMFLTGNYFPDKYAVLWELLFAKALGKTVALYAQTIGPFENETVRSRACWVLNRVDLITTRDAESKSLLEDIGVTETPIEFTADAAFTMTDDPPEPKPIQRITENGPDKASSDALAVSISVRTWGYIDREGGQDAYERVIAETADWLIDEHDANVRFLSTCTGWAGYHTDDRIPALSIIDQMSHGGSDRVSVDTQEYTTHELRDRYGQMDLHIGTRMHSNILAMLAETPVVAIAYEFKTKGLMRQFGLEDYLCDINAVDADSLTTMVDNAFSNRDELAEQIANQLPEQQTQSRKTATLIAETMG
ncbi:polysaccharide pyruvyl transferase family protein [Halococcus qingdaonensis]|uniref:polysaccharide pyruvyl transferase family protein n=1 Tax=Halococcus qingdaonensis TaxID=224402 RepID=UPI002115EA69|nr:polysaccharide pyruvyl transferase family protein [Halococcus qingdaonensis]